jgi:hypothetical protein
MGRENTESTFHIDWRLLGLLFQAQMMMMMMMMMMVVISMEQLLESESESKSELLFQMAIFK